MAGTCLFCGRAIQDEGLAFYDHVEEHPSCRFVWSHWMERIPQDHGGA